jgi:hypothetical protein
VVGALTDEMGSYARAYSNRIVEWAEPSEAHAVGSQERRGHGALRLCPPYAR